MNPAAHRNRCAFTLIELLVVIAIISLLLAIVLPSMSSARAKSKTSACLSNMREIGLSTQAYAISNEGAIPRGPASPMTGDPMSNWSDWMTNQLWIGSLDVATGLGPLLANELKQPKVLFCPADDTNDPAEELPKIEQRRPEDSYSSYFYRQLDQTTRDKFDDLGFNAAGLRAKALAMDANVVATGGQRRTNHEAKSVNIVYLDTHAQSVKNTRDVFSLRDADFAGFPASMERRLNEILVAADVADGGDPLQAPALP